MAQSVLQQFHFSLAEVQKSQKWYAAQVASMKRGQVTPNKLLAPGVTQHDMKITPGNLYFFYYDPKHKDTLPYYDMFPMVFPYKAIPGGFLGLNMHYLGYPERFALFKKLLDIKGSKIDDNTKIKYSWATVSSLAQVNSVNASIKHYLNDHVKSPFLRVAPQDWATSMLLPVERFVGASKEHVWRQSRKA